MFVKIYRYQIKNKNFKKWKRNNDIVSRLYRKLGCQFYRLIKKESNFFHIIELGFYGSKKEFLKITNQLDSNPEILMLYGDFLKLVHNKKFIEEDFETL